MKPPTDTAVPADVTRADGETASFFDTPLLAAKRRAFDHPTQANLDALITAAKAEAAPDEKAERVFQAVVYAFEGREIPDDLREHGMVRRALKFRAAERARLAAIVQEMRRTIEVHRKADARWRSGGYELEATHAKAQADEAQFWLDQLAALLADEDAT